jgi:orotate phosphoribosyltransferase
MNPEISSTTQTTDSSPLDSAQVEALFVESGALLEGHFLLASGRHSARYIEKFRILEQPRITSRLCGELARRFADQNVQCVVGPITGGIILAFEVGRQLGCRAVYAERDEDGRGFTLRRGFRLEPGERVLVVEDIVPRAARLSKSSIWCARRALMLSASVYCATAAAAMSISACRSKPCCNSIFKATRRMKFPLNSSKIWPRGETGQHSTSSRMISNYVA